MLKMQIGFLFPRWHFTKPKWIPKKQFIFFYFSLPQSSFGSFSSLLTFCPPAPVELTTNIVDNSSLFPLSCLSHTLSLLISLLPLSYRPFFSKIRRGHSGKYRTFLYNFKEISHFFILSKPG